MAPTMNTLKGPRVSQLDRAYDRDRMFRSRQLILGGLPEQCNETHVNAACSWSKDYIDAQMLQHDPTQDGPWRRALLTFTSHEAAEEARLMLHGKDNYTHDGTYEADLAYARTSVHSEAASETSSGNATPHPTRFYSHPREKVSPTNNGYGSNELPPPDHPHAYREVFSPHSPIGNHLNERNRISGKDMINGDSMEDYETGELIRDPISYAENSSRRSTIAQLPRMTNLSALSTTNGPSSQMALYQTAPQHSMLTSFGGPMSPMGNGGPPASYQLGSNHYNRHNFPPVNPADQNPPCNTLYVGNLPIDTNEDELKAMFSKQRGYKRLCFRTKANGPMCFVEFEDVSFATKALHELYGHPLHNSVKGGIRLSFSKNPLGVRSNQVMAGQNQGTPTGMMMNGLNGMVNGAFGGASFASANGPPPGLAAPPGLGQNRHMFNNGGGMMMGRPNGSNGAHQGNGAASFAGIGNGWMNQPNFPRVLTAGGHPSTLNGNPPHPSFPPAYMMGR